MTPRHNSLSLAALAVVLGCSAGAVAQTPRLLAPKPFKEAPLPAYNSAEPMAEALSVARSADYLDLAARDWMKPQMCGQCHSNVHYLMARPLLDNSSKSLVAQTRKFMEDKVTNPASRRSDSELVSIAAALAWDDARSTGKLQPNTRKALDEMWQKQLATGTWRKGGCGSFPPPEVDQFYTAALGAIAVGVAPDNYAQTPKAKDGLTNLRRYFLKFPPRDIHQKALVLWASVYVDGLLTTAERQATVKELLAAQRPDGGWSFPTLAPSRGHCDACQSQEYWQAMHAKAKLPDTPSDGYGTGFTVFVLRQAGVSATHPQITRGVGWLQSNQRVSGRWHSPSPDANVKPDEFQKGTRDLSILNSGTAFAILALKACEGAE